MSSGFALSLAVAAIVAGAPLLYATLGEILAERAGVINLGLEGVMLVGAATSVAVAAATHNPWAGVFAAIVAGVAMNGPFAFAVVSRGANQLAAGLSLLFLGLGASALIGKPALGALVPTLPTFSLHVARAGSGFDVLTLCALPVTAAVAWLLTRTRWGLRLRASGENPAAAYAAGCRPSRLRYHAILASGALFGLAGAQIALAITLGWAEGMTAGRGFIAIALVIFSRWNPWLAVPGALLFGGAEALQLQLQAAGIDASPFFTNMLPYLLTLAVLPLSARAGRNAMPASLGRPFTGVE
jgi:simple sugar transport system permease protein